MIPVEEEFHMLFFASSGCLLVEEVGDVRAKMVERDEGERHVEE